MEHTKTDHGYHENSRAVKYLLEVLTELNTDERRKFLLWVTGSPRLPIGGTNFSAILLMPCTWLTLEYRLEGFGAQVDHRSEGSGGSLPRCGRIPAISDDVLQLPQAS